MRLQPYQQQFQAQRRNVKLSPRFYGPYQVTERIREVAYCLGLPKSAQIHPMFHVSLLKKKVGHLVQTIPTLLPVDTLGILKLKPKAILDRRLRKKRSFPVVKMMVRWQGQRDEDTTWEGFH
ncbi:uncharacterized protein LOC109014405 [Juglans regia]|uniref:Uncharacterized protein LOC109014405 n=1 Tax=Juglans regia TaxID=51240 RepID=A0A2I4H8D6_JUGRE|nr:uncharacterized protein LOC109014405 [Juglans regia]